LADVAAQLVLERVAMVAVAVLAVVAKAAVAAVVLVGTVGTEATAVMGMVAHINVVVPGLVAEQQGATEGPTIQFRVAAAAVQGYLDKGQMEYTDQVLRLEGEEGLVAAMAELVVMVETLALEELMAVGQVGQGSIVRGK
jgi:hypothetical protein